MTVQQICIAAELACIERLPSREEALQHIEARLLKEPDDTVRRALKRAYHTYFERKEVA
jgi:hypothetical protein